MPPRPFRTEDFPVRSCIFCRSKADTREHLWPAWLLDRLPKQGLRLHEGQIGERQLFRYPAKTAELKARFVCAGCNQGWMSDIEKQNIPVIGALIQDIALPLDRVQQRALAHWCLKTAMAFESTTHSVREFYYSSAERDRLRLQQEVPENTTVWIGRYTGSRTIYAEAHDGWDKNFVLHSYVTTLTAMYLTIQVMSYRPPPHLRGQMNLEPKMGPWERSLAQVWPVLSPVSWPPKISFGDRHSAVPVDSLMNRWRGIPIRRNGTAVMPS
jgi:hypothetical protein